MYWISQIFLRGGIPLVIMALISLILKRKQNVKKSREVLIVGLIWFFVGGASLIYEIPNWDMIRKIIVHFLVMLLTVYPCLLFSGWFKFENLKDALKIFLIFLGIGLTIVIGFGIYYQLT